MDVAIGMHPFPTDNAPGFNKGFNMLTVETDPPGGGLEFFLRNPMSNIVDNLFSIGYVLVGGVLDRFPKLRFGIMESNGGWLCAFLDRLDHRMEHFRFQVPWVKMKPSEYFKQSCFISCDPDESMFEPTVRVLGADRIIWGSDFPHPDAFYPGIVNMLKRSMPNLNEDQQAKVLGNSGLRFYNLKV